MTHHLDSGTQTLLLTIVSAPAIALYALMLGVMTWAGLGHLIRRRRRPAHRGAWGVMPAQVLAGPN